MGKFYSKFYEVKALSHTGLKRKNTPNQDCVGIVLPSFFQHHPPLLMLADGMGGHAGGQIASRLVIHTVKENYLRSQLVENSLPFFDSTVLEAHKAIISRSNEEPELANMGSTLVAAVIYPRHIDVVNVGDSRAYIIRKNQLIQISQDQSVVAEKVRQGILSPKDAQHDSHRNQLTMSISAKRTSIKPFLNSSNLENKDVILLCSDGLWGLVPEPLIQAVAANFPPQEAASKLIQLANEAGGSDNISVVIAMPIEKVKQLKAKKIQTNSDSTAPGE